MVEDFTVLISEVLRYAALGIVCEYYQVVFGVIGIA